MPTEQNMEGLGASITRAASLQTYYTVRLLVDRPRVADAYRAYAYFRWLDDWLDEPTRPHNERLQFVERQTTLINACYAGLCPTPAAPEEQMLITLIAHDGAGGSGLQSYIRNMLYVMAFDAERRGRLISASELSRYEGSLAAAVTEALHYFIGHDAFAPRCPARHLAAEGAHIVHMLRDTVEDSELGYFNIPADYVNAHAISPSDVSSSAYRAWVQSRVELARSYFQAGRAYLAQVQSLRCRLAGYAYMGRFETVLDAIERDSFLLRAHYPDAKGAQGAARMAGCILSSAFDRRGEMADTGMLTTR